MGKIAIITGGSRGLGRSAAVHLARQGTDSILTYVASEGAAREVVAEIEQAGAKAVALPLDVGKSATFPAFAESVRKALRETWNRDRFDALVNNAGHGLHRPFIETSEAEFDTMVDVHLKGPFFLTQALVPLMEDGGRILNISTGLARFSMPGYSAYATMKGGIEVLTRYLAAELGARGISVNTLAPGAIATDFGGGAVRDNPELQKMIGSFTALGRAGLPEDIGPVIAMLLADGGRWINGQRIEASGGMNL